MRRIQGGPFNPDDPQGSRDLLLDQIDQPDGGLTTTAWLPSGAQNLGDPSSRDVLLNQMNDPPNVNLDEGPGAHIHTPTAPMPRVTDPGTTPPAGTVAPPAGSSTGPTSGAPAGLSPIRQRIWDNFHDPRNKNPLRDPNETDNRYWEDFAANGGLNMDQRMFDREGEGSNAGQLPTASPGGPSTPQRANHVDANLTGPVADAIAYLQQEAQRIGLAPLSQERLQQIAKQVGWQEGQPATGAMVNQAIDLMNGGDSVGSPHAVANPPVQGMPGQPGMPPATPSPTRSPGGDDWFSKLLAQLHLGEGTAAPPSTTGRL